MNRRFQTGEEGFTLLETVVSLALFLSVLIPVGVLIGNMLLDGRSDILAISLRECQSEMTRVITQNDFSTGKKSISSNLAIERTIRREGDLIEIDIVSILFEKHILTLHKTILAPR
jgi:hypothetical protein